MAPNSKRLSKIISEPDDFLFNPSKKIGGAVVPLFGMPGSGKTNAEINIGVENLKSGHIVVWKGSPAAQWVNFIANDTPVTVWNHEEIESFDAKITASTPEESPTEVDLESHRIESTVLGEEDVQAIRVKSFESEKDLVNRLDEGRVNVVNVPGRAEATEFKYPRYFYLKTWKDILHAIKERDWLTFTTILIDEINHIMPSQQQAQAPFNIIVSEVMPQILGDLRKNNVFLYGAGHATMDCHYMFWKVKSNALIYMAGANVKPEVTPQIEQKYVNKLDRGDFIMSGFEKADFALMKEANSLSWMPDNEHRKFRVWWEADVPDFLGEKQDASNEAIDKQQVILNERKRIAHTLNSDTYGWTQEQIGDLFDREQNTISEWVREMREKYSEKAEG